jgi:hypothetical protein
VPIVEAHIETDRPSRYLQQFCKHAAAMGTDHNGAHRHTRHSPGPRTVRVDADWSETRGVVTFTPWGRCTITTDGATLTVRIEADDEDDLKSIQDVVSNDFDRFGRRDGLQVTWRPCS